MKEVDALIALSLEVPKLHERVESLEAQLDALRIYLNLRQVEQPSIRFEGYNEQ